MKLILSEHRREDIEFIPHVGLGLFVKKNSKYVFKNPQELILDEETYRRALLKAELMIIDFYCTIDNLDFVEVSDSFTQIKAIKNVTLNLCSK